MSTAMPYDHQRQRMIKAHLTEQENSAGGKERLPREKLIVKGQARQEPVYRLSVRDLAFNKANGRIKAEALEKEAELGRELEYSNKEDQDLIREILLAIRPDENDKIREDLKTNGQMRPGIITCDGVVINGNRRKAIFEELYDKTGQDQYKYLDVQVLPSDITKSELWLIEAGIQLSAPQQLDYSPINHLLKLREGIDSGVDIKDMAARIFGASEDNINDDLARLNLVDEYLKDFVQKPEHYYLVKQLNEHFIDLHEIIRWAKRPRGGSIRLDWKPDASDINELKLVGFYYIRIKFPHLRIRNLRDLFATEQSWSQVKEALTVDAELTPQERATLSTKPAEKISDEDDDLDRDGPEDKSSTLTEEQHLQEEALWKTLHEERLKSFYEDAKEQEQIVRDSARPLALAKRALKNIEAIPNDQDKLTEREIDDVLRQIIGLTNELRRTIQKPSARRAVSDRLRRPIKKGSKKVRR